MSNPLKLLAIAFAQAEPQLLLFVGTGISVLASIALFIAAKGDGVLHIAGGVGLFENYGLIASLLTSAMLPYLVRLYCDEVRGLGRGIVTQRSAAIQNEMIALDSMLRLEGKNIRIFYIFALVGLMFWVSNVSFHVLGYSPTHWGDVFDALQNTGSFIANRIFNVYSWVFLIPFCGYVVLLSSMQMVRAIRRGATEGSIHYDLLNPDQWGGFSAVRRAHVIFNLLLAITYLQIVLYTTTFDTMNIEHLVAYIGLTLIFLFGNTIFLAGANHQIKKLRIEALNACKDKIYSGENLQFEIFKYAQEARPNKLSWTNVIMKSATVLVSLAIKFYPFLSSSSKYIPI